MGGGAAEGSTCVQAHSVLLARTTKCSGGVHAPCHWGAALSRCQVCRSRAASQRRRITMPQPAFGGSLSQLQWVKLAATPPREPWWVFIAGVALAAVQVGLGVGSFLSHARTGRCAGPDSLACAMLHGVHWATAPFVPQAGTSCSVNQWSIAQIAFVCIGCFPGALAWLRATR